MKSILQESKECFVTHDTRQLHKHHIYEGRNRKVSDDNGFWVWLRADWHNLSNYGVHNDKEFDLRLKRLCQMRYEALHSHEEFMKLIGRSYI